MTELHFLTLQHDVLEEAPTDQGCRCAVMLSMLKQVIEAIETGKSDDALRGMSAEAAQVISAIYD